jgi:hypothetical protein
MSFRKRKRFIAYNHAQAVQSIGSTPIFIILLKTRPEM